MRVCGLSRDGPALRASAGGLVERCDDAAAGGAIGCG
jgi:hypothetical protein